METGIFRMAVILGVSVRKGLYVDEKLVVLFYPGWTDALLIHHPAITVEHYYYCCYYFIIIIIILLFYTLTAKAVHSQ